MCPFSVTVQYVPDRELGPLLTQLSEAGYDKPLINHVDAMVPLTRRLLPARAVPVDLPDDWRLVREREGESYRWPKDAISTSPTACSWAHARRRRGADRAWGDDSREQVGPRPKVRRPS